MKSSTTPLLRLGVALIIAGLALALMFGGWVPPASAAQTELSDFVLYGDALDSSFQSWSFDTTVNFAATSPTYGGSARSIAVTYRSGNWGALWLVRPGGDIDLTTYTAIRFAIHGGMAGGQSIRVQAGSGTGYPAAHEVPLNTYLPGGPVANAWREVTIPLSAFGLTGSSLGSLAFQSSVSTGQPTFYIDEIRLVAGTPPPPPPGITATIRIRSSGVITPVQPTLLGSNLTAWLNPTRLQDPVFRERTRASGIRLLRMPGGSWSNAYGWLSCEMGANQPGAQPCYWTWAARPTDFLNFLRATGIEGMWAVNPNGTSKEAAALVAFFNGDVNDNRVIGVDLRGTDWYTVGHWARLRALHGNPQPLGIKLWEVGNEVYGGKPEAGGPLCQSWGWEDVWTCDGTEYVLGKGTGAARHEGYLEFRAAMRAVDPTILVGAVGFEEPGDPAHPDWSNYNNWGLKVMAAAGEALDFYSIHPYAYYQPPANTAAGHAEILAKPQSQWREMRTRLDAAFDAFAPKRAPVAVTEFNLVSVGDQDTAQLMTRAVNALFLADSLGQAIQQGYAIFTQWAINGSLYGLMHEEQAYERAPQYYVFPLWARFGTTMLPVTTTLNATTQAAVYAGRVDTDTLSVLVINKTAMPITATLSAEQGPVSGGEAYEVRATSAAAQSVTYNGFSSPSNALTEPPTLLSAVDGRLTLTLAPWSITLVHLNVQVAPTAWRSHVYLPLVWRKK